MKHPRFKICWKLLHLQDNLLTAKKRQLAFSSFQLCNGRLNLLIIIRNIKIKKSRNLYNLLCFVDRVKHDIPAVL